MNDLLREIEEDIRRERLAKLWNSFGRLMVMVSIAIVITTVVIVLVQNHRQQASSELTAQFMQGLDRMNIEDYKGAIVIFTSLSEDENSNYYGLAMLRKAEAQMKLGDKDGSIATYKALAQHSDPFGELAKMLAPVDANVLRTPEKSSLFYDTQSEWKGWQLVAAGKKDEAAAIFSVLRDDPLAPQSQRARSSEVVQHIAPEVRAQTDSHD